MASEMGRLYISVILLLVVMGVREIEPSGDAMKYLASGFIQVINQCKQELNLNDQVMVDLYYYWKLDYSRLSRDTGCAIICMSKKLDLMDANGKLHHGNTQEFALSHGADPEIASKLVAIIHGCEQQQHNDEDECLRVLEVAKCFRTGIHELGWTPKVDVIVEEVLTDI